MIEEPKEEKKIEKEEKEEQEKEEEEVKEEHIETLSKNKCMDLINSDDNIDELFAITEYKHNKIRFHIFDDLQRVNLIENDIDNNIEFIEDDKIIIKAGRIENGTVKKDISFPATRELMIVLTKNVGDEFDKNALYQFNKIYEICLKPECDKHIFRIGKGRPSKNHYNFLVAIDERMKKSRKFKYLTNVIKGLGYKEIALQLILRSPDTSDQVKRIFVLLRSLRCANDNPDIQSEFSELLDQLYKDNKNNKLLYKSLYYKGKNALDKNLKK